MVRCRLSLNQTYNLVWPGKSSLKPWFLPHVYPPKKINLLYMVPPSNSGILLNNHSTTTFKQPPYLLDHPIKWLHEKTCWLITYILYYHTIPDYLGNWGLQLHAWTTKSVHKLGHGDSPSYPNHERPWLIWGWVKTLVPCFCSPQVIAGLKWMWITH